MKAHTAPHLALSSFFTLLLIIFLASILLPGGCALDISSAKEFISFASNVNTGTNNYKGETVYLTADIDMTGYSSQFEPVGKSIAGNTFLGAFDGQGHTFSNLAVSSDSFGFLGIFGISWGTTIKNLVVDNTCSFESSYPEVVTTLR